MVPKGFLFSAVEAAIKKPGRKDLALIYSEHEADMAGVFTSNAVKAAPVRLAMQRIRAGRGQAVIVNSGNANACTGRRGLDDAREMTALVARELRVRPSRVFVCSTGVIGIPLPMERIRPKIAELIAATGTHSLDDVAAAMMTTDRFPKVVAKKVTVDGKTGVIAGVCKGAGMICPRLATMLCFLLTDIRVESETLDACLRDAVGTSFNRITVDGDMSTNDTVLIMANGLLGNSPLRRTSRAFRAFRETLAEVSFELSKRIVEDGEGATKLVEIEVKGARTEVEAEKAAFSVANSKLVKTAIYGNDANWGRVMAALGYSGIGLREEKVDIFFGPVPVVRRGVSTDRDEAATRALRKNEVKITIALNMGKASARVLTCDLTEEYIRVNAAYRT